MLQTRSPTLAGAASKPLLAHLSLTLAYLATGRLALILTVSPGSWIAKPYHRETLAAAIRGALEREKPRRRTAVAKTEKTIVT
jgi:hypothetical protein